MGSGWAFCGWLLHPQVALPTAIHNFRLFLVMGRQLTAMQDSSRAESGLGLIAFLQSQEIRDARRVVRSVLSQKPIADWSQAERDAAAMVVANYDVAAALLRSGLLSVELVTTNWGPSIKHCYAILEPFIEELRARPGGHEKYWSNFRWLRDQCA